MPLVPTSDAAAFRASASSEAHEGLRRFGVVVGCVRDDFWRGWSHFFSIAGQLNIQVARDYYVSNVGRHNIRWLPVTGIPGAFYCTWSAIFLEIPGRSGQRCDDVLLVERGEHLAQVGAGLLRDGRERALEERLADDRIDL